MCSRSRGESATCYKRLGGRENLSFDALWNGGRLWRRNLLIHIGLLYIVIALDVHKGGNEESAYSDDQIQDTSNPEPGLVPGGVCDGTRDQESDRHHRLCHASDEREDTSLHIGLYDTLKECMDGTIDDRHHKSEDCHRDDHDPEFIGGCSGNGKNRKAEQKDTRE